MSEQEQEQEQEQEAKQGQKTYTEEDVKRMIEEQTSGLKSKVDELLGETKQERERRQQLEQEQQEAEEERRREKGEFKELYETERSEKQRLQEQFEEFQARIQRQEINMEASSIAGELTRDTSRAELLSEKAAQYAKYSDDGVQFELGGVPVDREKVVEHLKEKYPFLADGSGASGGGATGRGAEPQKKPEEYTEQERVQLYKENPDKFREIFNVN